MYGRLLEQAAPFAAEVQWRDVGKRHLQQVRIETGQLFRVALDSLGRQFLRSVLQKELPCQQRERLWERRRHAGAGLRQIVLLLFLNAAIRLGNRYLRL